MGEKNTVSRGFPSTVYTLLYVYRKKKKMEKKHVMLRETLPWRLSNESVFSMLNGDRKRYLAWEITFNANGGRSVSSLIKDRQ